MINCCNGCVPPKRTPTCHFDGTCDKYIKAKEKHDAEREEQFKKSELRRNLYEQQCNAVRKAVNAKRRGKDGKQKVD